MEIDEIVDYATKSPENTNPAVLRSMLSQLNSGGVMWVNITITGKGDTVSYSADKTNAEIYSAVNSGKMVFCRVGMGDMSRVRVCSLVYFAPNSATFSQTSYSDGAAYSEQIDIDNDVVNWTTWTWTVEDDS